MASPFRVFRKHQKILIATLGLMAMVAFVFLSGPVLDAIMSGGSRDPVRVSTTAYGDLRASELAGLMQQRQMLLGLFEQILAQGQVPPQFVAMAAMQIFGPAEEEAVVNTWLMAERAKSLGMVVDDREINAFLQNFLSRYTQGEVTAAELAELLRRRNIPQALLFSALHRELLAQKVLQTFQPSTLGIPPLQRWTFYRQLNQQVTAELLPVEVEQFIDEVPAPSDAELKQFFNEHKDQEWRPDTPTPGFRQPERVAMTYYKAEYEQFVDPSSIPEDEVRQYYEQTKDTLYRLPADAPVPGATDEEATSADDDASPAEQGPDAAEEPADDDQAVEGQAVADQDQDDAATAEGEEPPVDEGEREPVETDAQPTDEQSADEQSADETDSSSESESPDESEPETTPDQPSQDDQSRHGVSVPIRLVALNQQDAASDAEAPAEEEPAAGEKSPADEEPAADQAEPDQYETPANDDDAGQTDHAQATDTEESPATDDAEPEGDAEPVPAQPEAPVATEPRYRPLSEVEDDIRRFLASRKADERINEVLGELQAKVRRYYDDLTVYEVAKAEDEQAEAPELLDFAALAKQYGVSLYETELISPWELRTLDIGEAQVGRRPLIQMVFDRPALHRPEIAQDDQRNHYLFWVDQHTEANTPEWSEQMRDQVLTAWKMVHARRLAREAAEELAVKARKADRPLAELPEVGSKAFTAGPFSWLTYGNVPPSMARGLPELGEVQGVEFPGDELMATAYRLDVGEVGVAMDQPETNAFVIRPVKFEPTDEELWGRFLRDSFQKYQGAAVRAQVEIARAWRAELHEEAGLQWHELPDRQ